MSKNKLEHIAFILDGNKRWAKKKKISLKESYKHGLQNIGNLINNCLKIKIPHLTLFTLSSENVQRKSVSNIFQVIYDEFSLFFEDIINEKLVKINVIGSKENLPIKILNLINHCEEKIKKLFLLGNIPDPDFLIRTGGEKRLSNFIMYNLTYTEIFFINTLWPEFNNKELMKIISEYNDISRRYGL